MGEDGREGEGSVVEYKKSLKYTLPSLYLCSVDSRKVKQVQLGGHCIHLTVPALL